MLFCEIELKFNDAKLITKTIKEEYCLTKVVKKRLIITHLSPYRGT